MRKNRNGDRTNRNFFFFYYNCSPFTQIWRGVLRSERAGLLTHANESLTGVTFDEHHRFFTSFMHEVGASVSVKQHIELKGTWIHTRTASKSTGV